MVRRLVQILGVALAKFWAEHCVANGFRAPIYQIASDRRGAPLFLHPLQRSEIGDNARPLFWLKREWSCVF